MGTMGFGRVLLALSLAALGACNLFFPHFEPAWQLLPHWVPMHDAAAMVVAGVLFVAGLALLFPGAAGPASLVLSFVLLVRLLVLHGTLLAKYPLVQVVEPIGENLVELAGVWIIYSMTKTGWLSGFGHVRAGQIIFGLALLPLGLSHFFFLGQTAGLIPSWLPFHVPLAYLTGAAHFAAGVAILVGVLAALAATLEAVMVSLFTLLVWVPLVIAAPHSAGNWGEILVSTAISGAAWIVAASLRTHE